MGQLPAYLFRASGGKEFRLPIQELSLATFAYTKPLKILPRLCKNLYPLSAKMEVIEGEEFTTWILSIIQKERERQEEF